MSRARSPVRAGLLLLALALTLVLTLAAPPAFSHGGEDHTAPDVARAAVVGTTHVGSGETEAFSVVVKYPAKPAEGSLAVRVYVADAGSSAPVTAASVRLELKGDVTVDQEAKTTGAPGVYEATIPAPADGAHADGIVSVQTRTAFDLVLLGKLSFGPMDPPPAPAAARSEGMPIWQMVAGALTVAAAAGTAGFAVGRRSRKRAPAEGARADEKRAPAEAKQ